MSEQIFQNQDHIASQWLATITQLKAEREKASGGAKGALTRKINDANKMVAKLTERGIQRTT